MKHICFFSPGAYPYLSGKNTGTSGGAELVQSLIAKELAKRKDYQIFVVVDDFGQDNLEIHDNVFVYKCPMKNKNKLVKLYNILATLYEIDADIYCQRGAMAETGLIALFCELKKKKFVYSVAHDYEVN